MKRVWHWKRIILSLYAIFENKTFTKGNIEKQAKIANREDVAKIVEYMKKLGVVEIIRDASGKEIGYRFIEDRITKLKEDFLSS